MSNRSLIEINHDYWDRIRDDPAAFAAALVRYLNSGSTLYGVGDELRRYGVTVHGMRHHSEGWENFISDLPLKGGR